VNREDLDIETAVGVETIISGAHRAHDTV